MTDGPKQDRAIGVSASRLTHFGEKELADLTLAVATINAWNRLSIAARLVPGKYQPATAAK